MLNLHKNICISLWLGIAASVAAYAQDAPADTTKLPFAIANEKRLPEDELAHKREGAYITGAPDLSSDPVNGLGLGVEGSLYFNGKRKDPFFAYTPYRQKLDFVVFSTTRQQREFFVRLDMPYAFNTKWRIRAEGGYESNPNLLYFGINERTLQGLSYYPNNDSSLPLVQNARFKDYNAALVGNAGRYNTYFKKEWVANVSGEYALLDGKMRALIGLEAAGVNISTFSPYARLAQDRLADKQVLGDGKYLVTIGQLGLMYDTRDLETDPTNGVFAEITNELSLKSLGSAFNFNKTFVHAALYRRLFPHRFKRLVFAGRLAAGYTAGDAPFFEYQDQWTSEGSIEGLGGTNTLRGFKQGRFLGRVMNFNNFELRYRFAEMTTLKQHLVFSAVPFLDIGGVWNSFGNIKGFQNFRSNEGVGLRVAWNVSTILRFDYAVSKEDAQFFFSFGHAF